MSLLKIFNSIAILFLLGLSLSCEYEKMEEPDLDSIPEVISFQEHIIPIFEARCSNTSCHGGTVSPNLTIENAYFDLTNGNFLNINNPENSNFYKKITGNGSMAQYANDLDRAFILKWIEQGAEDN